MTPNQAQKQNPAAPPTQAFTLIELLIVITIIVTIAAVAIPNLLRSRMSANEAATIAACREYSNAQAIYKRTDWDEDGVLEYSVKITGSNSLFTEDTNIGDVGLVDAAFVAANGQPGNAVPKVGYVFEILTGQGTKAPGGAKSYVIFGNMTIGFGLSAVPDSWDMTGRNSFQTNTAGVVYQKDRMGLETAHLTTFEPDTSWAVSE